MRLKNEGTIYEAPKGSGIWYAQLPPDAAGKRPKRRASSAEEARQKLRELERERSQGVNTTTTKPTIADLVELWLDQVVRRQVRPSTLAEYRYQVAALTKRIGKVRVAKLTAALLQKTLNTIADEVSAIVAEKAYLRIRAALKTAVRWKYTGHNVALDVDPPRAKTAEHEPPDLAAVLAILEQLDGQHAVFFQLVATLGLRHGEALGLVWRNVRWDAATIEITQQVTRYEKALHVTDPKTPSSKRVLPLPPGLLAELRALWERQKTERKFIFPAAAGGPSDAHSTRKAWRAACAGAGLPLYRVHDLRHFTATQLGERDVPEHIIGAILGHSRAKTVTRKYTHATTQKMRQALEDLERQLARRAA